MRFVRSSSLLLGLLVSPAAGAVELLNVAFDPVRGLYEELDASFVERWREREGEDIRVRRALGGSRAQSWAVREGLEADVLTLALAAEVDALARETGLVPAGWRERLPNGRAPFASTVVFVVREGNPLGIRDWGDLVRPGVEVVTSDPDGGGVARWTWLAAWGWALRHNNGNVEATKSFVAELYRHAAVLFNAPRGAARQFLERGAGDVFITWENEAMTLTGELSPERYDMVVPSASILAEPGVTIVDDNVDRHGTRRVAEAWLDHLWSPEAQAMAVRHHYRPADPGIAVAGGFTPLELFSVDEVFGGWERAEAVHFRKGGLVDVLVDR